jgi:hypothetical protein
MSSTLSDCPRVPDVFKHELAKRECRAKLMPLLRCCATPAWRAKEAQNLDAVAVGASTIKGAGNGLLVKHAHVLPRGAVLPLLQMTACNDAAALAPLDLRFTPSTTHPGKVCGVTFDLDRELSKARRYTELSQRGATVDLCLVTEPHLGTALACVVRRDVRSGEELFRSYGAHDWRLRELKACLDKSTCLSEYIRNADGSPLRFETRTQDLEARRSVLLWLWLLVYADLVQQTDPALWQTTYLDMCSEFGLDHEWFPALTKDGEAARQARFDEYRRTRMAGDAMTA